MSARRKGPFSFLRSGACSACNALFQCAYSSAVLLLGIATLFAAYVATLDEVPVPSFVTRELQNVLKAEGLALQMEEIRLRPNGRILIDEPRLHSPELKAKFFEAKQASLKLSLLRLLIRSVKIDEVHISSGRLILPAMLSRSGEPSVLLSSINLEASRQSGAWTIRYAHCKAGTLKLAVSGVVDPGLVARAAAPSSESEPRLERKAPAGSIAMFGDLAQKASQLYRQLESFSSPYAILNLDLISKSQVATLQVGAEAYRIGQGFTLHQPRLKLSLDAFGALAARLEADRLEHSRHGSVERIHLAAQWDTMPKRLQPYPSIARASAAKLRFAGYSIPGLVMEASPHNTLIQSKLQLGLPSSPAEIEVRYRAASSSTDIHFAGLLDSEAGRLISEAAAAQLPEIRSRLLEIDTGIELLGQLRLDQDFHPAAAHAYATSGKAALIGAQADYARIEFSYAEKKLSVPTLKLRNGRQSGNVSVDLDLDTLKRRVVVEGSFDPNAINDWFGPWWSSIWDGMRFPPAGMLTYLDSQAIMKRPRKPESYRHGLRAGHRSERTRS